MYIYYKAGLYRGKIQIVDNRKGVVVRKANYRTKRSETTVKLSFGNRGLTVVGMGCSGTCY